MSALPHERQLLKSAPLTTGQRKRLRVLVDQERRKTTIRPRRPAEPWEPVYARLMATLPTQDECGSVDLEQHVANVARLVAEKRAHV